MFKRVEKKLAKKKKDEELGFSEEIKEAIGLIDSDSDDSSSDESEASSSTSNLPVPSKRKRLLDDGLDASSDVNSEGQGSGAADDPEDYEDEPGVQMSVEEALHDPLYIISIQPDIRGCIICPRKLLKNNTMTSVHMKSQVCHIHCMSRYGNLMTFVTFLLRRPISDGYPSSRKRPHLPNPMTTLSVSCPSLLLRLRWSQSDLPLPCRTARLNG